MPVHDHIGIVLPHEVDNLRRINGSMAVVGIEFDTRFLAQMVHALAVLATAERKIVALRRFESTKPLEGNGYLVMGTEEGFL
jgi:hypothetical protein